MSVCPLRFFLLFAGILVGTAAIAADNQSKIENWQAFIKPGLFGDREIIEGKSIIELRVPQRAEDSGVVPISMHAGIPQTAERYIKTVHVIIDRNPKPVAGKFTLTPEMGRADLAMRLRIDQFTHVRAVAELNTGELYMDTAFTRASGGCSEPPPFLELKAARERIGQMKFRVSDDGPEHDVSLAQLMISHPNITGLQLDQRTRAFIPADYVTKVVVKYNDRHVMTAETDISISEDPSFRFFFRPEGGGVVTAEMTDSKGRHFTRTFEVEG
ncbi:MAG: quinoprotein dehydrogenase-associated SoxYZ-like carrier [Gammaproteobacteria bacterium]|nr:quinoprotein dehydrogenase-associated SoxYZ-like carrier [Gammaproteobacteria bacterium]